MSSAPRVVYQPCESASPKGGLDALATIYDFILCSDEAERVEEMKKGTRPGAPNAGKEIDERSGNHIIPNR